MAFVCFGVLPIEAQEELPFEFQVLREAYRAKLVEIDERIESERKAPLLEKYDAALERLENNEAERGNLPGLAAIRAERGRAKEAGAIASRDIVKSPRALADMQRTLLKELEKATKARELELARLRGGYVAKLKVMRADYTKRKMVDAALAVEGEINRLSVRRVGDEIVNGRGMKLCWIPAGRFTMGSPEGELGREADKEAQVEVELTCGFWMGKYEVTQGEWEAVMGTSLRDENEKVGGGQYKGINGEGKDHPMYQVNWEQAKAFCAKLTEAERKKGKLPEGWVYTLPTEAQWEYACRAGEEGSYSGGELDEVGWYKDNSGGKTHEVGQRKANAWGLHDMHGNVHEWCRDWYGNNLPGGVDPEVTAKARYRVYRGGSWGNLARTCRAADRGISEPAYWNYGLGFRLVLSPVRR